MTGRNFARLLLPPILLEGMQRLRGSQTSRISDAVRFVGDYKTWDEAEQASTGYSASNILEKTRIAMLKVKRGEAVYERDSLVFDQIVCPFPVLAGLLRARATSGHRLSVLDFGGSLGTTYFACRNFLSRLGEFRWSVVEQPDHVECGRDQFSDDQLHFYATIDECLRNEKPNLLLLSGVIQHLPNPYEFLADALAHEFHHVIVDRTAFFVGGRDLLTVQHVPEWIYRATYPAWFLSEERFLSKFRKRYDMIVDFPALDTLQPDKGQAYWKGFIFELRN